MVAVIGFNQKAYTFEEGDHTVEVCAAFLDPGQTAPNIVVELMGSISPSTYHACCVNVVMQKSTHAWAKYLISKLAKEGGGYSQVLFCLQPRKSAHVKCSISPKQISEQCSEQYVTIVM